jgi:hypothetical protein
MTSLKPEKLNKIGSLHITFYRARQIESRAITTATSRDLRTLEEIPEKSLKGKSIGNIVK